MTTLGLALGVPALLALGLLQGMRYAHVIRERRRGAEPRNTPGIWAGMAVAGAAVVVAVIALLR